MRQDYHCPSVTETIMFFTLKFTLYLTSLLLVSGKQCPADMNADFNYMQQQKHQQEQQQEPLAIFIINGHKLSISKVPYQCVLTVEGAFRDGRNSSELCGCVITNRRFIVTAAHCFDSIKPKTSSQPIPLSHDVKVQVGIDNIYQTLEYLKVQEYVTHVRYAQSASYKPSSDIAVIMLAHPLDFNENVQPIRIISNNDYAKDKKPVYVSGYGSIKAYGEPDTNTKLWGTNMVTVGWEKCKQRWKNVGTIIDETVVCALAPRRKQQLLQSVCKGDSGGPMIANTQPPALVGLTSFGSANCTQEGEAPAVFTNVYLFKNWIKAQKVQLCKRYTCSQHDLYPFDD